MGDGEELEPARELAEGRRVVLGEARAVEMDGCEVW